MEINVWTHQMKERKHGIFNDTMKVK